MINIHSLPIHQNQCYLELNYRFSFAGMKAQIYDIVRIAGLSPGEMLPEVHISA